MLTMAELASCVQLLQAGVARCRSGKRFRTAVEVAPPAAAVPRSVPRKQRDPSAMTPAKMIMKASMQAWKEKASELQSNARDPALDGKIAHTRPGWMRTCGAY